MFTSPAEAQVLAEAQVPEEEQVHCSRVGFHWDPLSHSEPYFERCSPRFDRRQSGSLRRRPCFDKHNRSHSRHGHGSSAIGLLRLNLS